MDIVDIIGLLTLHHRVGLYILHTVFGGQLLKSAGTHSLNEWPNDPSPPVVLSQVLLTVSVLLYVFKSSGSHISSCQRLLNRTQLSPWTPM